MRFNLDNLSLSVAFFSFKARLKSSHNRLMFSMLSSSSMTRFWRRGSPRRALLTHRHTDRHTYRERDTHHHTHHWTHTHRHKTSPHQCWTNPNHDWDL